MFYRTSKLEYVFCAIGIVLIIILLINLPSMMERAYDDAREHTNGVMEDIIIEYGKDLRLKRILKRYRPS